MREFPEGLWMDQTFLVPFFFLQVMPRVLLQTGCRAQVWKGAHATKMDIFLVLKHAKIKECHLLSLRTVCIVSVQAVANRYQQEHFGFPVAHLQLLAATITTLGREIWLFHIKAVRARSALSFPHVLSPRWHPCCIWCHPKLTTNVIAYFNFTWLNFALLINLRSRKQWFEVLCSFSRE